MHWNEHPQTDEHLAACVSCMMAHDKQLPDSPKALPFIGIAKQVMCGSRCVAVASTHTFAKRIARALNNHKVNSRGY